MKRHTKAIAKAQEEFAITKLFTYFTVLSCGHPHITEPVNSLERDESNLLSFYGTGNPEYPQFMPYSHFISLKPEDWTCFTPFLP